MKPVKGDLGAINTPVDYRAFFLSEIQRGRSLPPSAMFTSLEMLIGAPVARWLNRCWWPRQQREDVHQFLEALDAVFALKGFDPTRRRFSRDSTTNVEAQARFDELAYAVIVMLASSLDGLTSCTKTRRRVIP